jgi:hypothetical protein
VVETVEKLDGGRWQENVFIADSRESGDNSLGVFGTCSGHHPLSFHRSEFVLSTRGDVDAVPFKCWNARAEHDSTCLGECSGILWIEWPREDPGGGDSKRYLEV